MPSKLRLAAIAVTAAGGFALAAPAGAQLLSHKDVSASIAIAIVQATIENSFRKAYTARTFRSPSGALVERVKADPTLGLIHLTNVIANQGALPIKVEDEVIGAAGASGAPGGEKDEACVKAALDKVADQLK